MSINAEVALNDGHNPVELQVAIKKLRKATADAERLVRDRKRRGAMSRSQKRRLKPARSADSLVLVAGGRTASTIVVSTGSCPRRRG